jgi:hypothetical protein
VVLDYNVNYMIPSNLRPLFWDTDLDTFTPEAHPDYTIFRVLELGDEAAVNWLRKTFTEAEILQVLKSERRLSEKSANFWALVYRVPSREVAALNRSR